MPPRLPQPACYVPFAEGRYDVRPGLFRFGHDFGNGAADRQVCQLDLTFCKYRDEKQRARGEQLHKYYLTDRLGPETATCVMQFLVEALVRDHPGWFAVERCGERSALRCALSRDSLCFDRDWRLDGVASEIDAQPHYFDALDALACQVQEDLAVVQIDRNTHRAAALHVCFPSAWSPAEKIGLNFAAIHEPVPHAEGMNRRGAELARTMVGAKDGLVRFVWGITTDPRLNHHPQAWQSAPFDPARPSALLRVERQTILGFPDVAASLFLIRTYLTDCRQIKKDHLMRDQLCAAISSMSHASLVYKGLDNDRDALLDWLMAT